MGNTEPLLSVRHLSVGFHTPAGVFSAVEDVSFDILPGQVLGLVGESGCGKTTAALSVLRLIPSPAGKITSGSIVFEGQDLLTLSESRLRKVRGHKIAMVFQDPMTSLNPVFTVGSQMREMFALHQPDLDQAQVARKCVELFERVGLPDAEQRLQDYPHQLSGGMRQRVMIAMALSCNPALLIADEPTTALDVTTQLQILTLIRDLQRDMALAVLLITHDFDVISHVADEVGVMYAGSIIEQGRFTDVLENTQHPYTYGLLKSVPSVADQKKRLYAIPGNLPSLGAYPKGCRFSPRCTFRTVDCDVRLPDLEAGAQGHLYRCIHPQAWKG